MSYGYYAQVALILMYSLIVVANLPGFYRVMRDRSNIFDSLKACVTLLALSLLNGYFLRWDSGVAFRDSNDFERIVAASLTGAAFMMLCIVLFKTARALNSGGKS